jgi:hypothetical protein
VTPYDGSMLYAKLRGRVMATDRKDTFFGSECHAYAFWTGAAREVVTKYGGKYSHYGNSR